MAFSADCLDLLVQPSAYGNDQRLGRRNRGAVIGEVPTLGSPLSIEPAIDEPAITNRPVKGPSSWFGIHFSSGFPVGASPPVFVGCLIAISGFRIFCAKRRKWFRGD